MRIKLDTKNIATLPVGFYSDTHRDGIDLTLWVRSNGTRTYLYRWQRHGIRDQITIGTIQKKGAYASWRADWSPLVRKDFLASFETHILPKIGSRATETLTTDDLVPLLQPIWHRETGRRMAQRIKVVIGRAIQIDKSHRFRAKINAADGLFYHLYPIEVVREHRAAMPYEDVPAFYARLCADQSMASYALRFLIATCAPRAAEVYGMRWGEVFDGRWNIPAGRAGRMKNKSNRRTVRDIPLSSEALAILDAIRPAHPDDDAFVFSGRDAGKRIGIHAMRLLLRRAKVEDDVHGFRTSFKSWGLAHMEHPLDKDAIEVAHDRAIGGAVAEVYRDTTLIGHRGILAERWACYLHGRAYTGPVAAPLLRLVA
jgi:integrase